MRDQEIATQIVDKYWKKSGFTEPNPYLLEADIAQALRSVRQEENEAIAQMLLGGEDFKHYHDNACKEKPCIACKWATAIRNRLKSQGEPKEKGEGRG